jgi:hypothetical protein
MKLKNGFLMLALFGSVATSQRSQAVVYPDQVTANANFGDSEDENQDSVSRFGDEENQKQGKQAKAMRPLDPISEDSFAHEASRGIASVTDTPTKSNSKKKSAQVTMPKSAIISRAKRVKSYQEAAVIANETGFYPATIFLTQGIPARLFVSGASAKSQCFMLDQFGVRRQIRSQKIEEITFVPDTVGTFTFSCPMNGAKGNIVVKELEVGGRIPATVSVSSTQERELTPAVAPVETKKSEIEENDFTPEFRNH